MITREAVNRHLREHLWYGPAAAGVFAVVLSAVAYVAGLRFGDAVDLDIGQSELVSLLGIFATSMLTVATFTISAIVSSAASVTDTTTPRAARLVLSDGRGQSVLSAFIAAFIYSVIGILALQAFDFRPFGRFVLFAGLIVIIAVVLVAFIGWIDRVQKLGQQEHMIDRLREATFASLSPDCVGTFGARVWDGERPGGARSVHADRTGYVAQVFIEDVQTIAAEHDLDVIVVARPGEVTDPTLPLAHVVEYDGRLDDDAFADVAARLRDAVVLSPQRQYEQDVRFNVVNLAETADRALSPGVNDPGTAINILVNLQQVFERYVDAVHDPDTTEVRFDRVSVPPLLPEELVSDAFTSIARDGAGAVEVVVRLQKTLRAIDRLGDVRLSRAVRAMSAVSLELAEHALSAQAHLVRVREVSEWRSA